MLLLNSLTQHKRMLDKGRTIREDLNLSSSSVTFLLFGFMSICLDCVWKQAHPEILFNIHNTPPLPINSFDELEVFSVIQLSVNLTLSFILIESNKKWNYISFIARRVEYRCDYSFNIQVSDGIQIIEKFNRIRH